MEKTQSPIKECTVDTNEKPYFKIIGFRTKNWYKFDYK
jgi:hypothetical protein